MNIIFFSNYKGFDESDYTTIIRVPFWTEVSKHIGSRGKILIVNHPVSLLGMLYSYFYRLNRPIVFFSSASKINNHLYTSTPFSFFNFRLIQHSSVFLKLFRFHMSQVISKYMRRFKFDTTIPCVVVVSHPFHLVLKNLFEETSFIYHCADDFVLFNTKNIDKADILVKKQESKLVNEADIVFYTAKSMREKFVRDNLEAYYLPNCVDFDLFNQVQGEKLPIDDIVQPIPQPRIGFVGVLSNRCDVDLIHALLTKRKDWSFVFIGKCGTNFEVEYNKLKVYTNFYDLGWQPYHRLPRFLKGIDVAILPYKTRGLLTSVNPNKMYQYMAAGIPIVSTPLSEAKRFEDCISIADNVDGFIRAIERNIDSPDFRRIKRQISLARIESCENKAKYFLYKINEHLRGIA